MAEPVTSIIGLVSASVSLAEKIYLYVSSAANAPRHARDFAAEVNAAAGALDMLRAHLQRERSNAFERTSVLFFAANGCKQQLEDIFRKLEPLTRSGASRSAERFRWPLRESDTRHAVESLQRYVQVFAFVYNLDGLSIVSTSQSDAIAQLQRRLDGLAEQPNDIRHQLSEILRTVQTLPYLADSATADELLQLGQRFEKFVVDEKMSRLLSNLSSLSFGEKHRDLQLRRMEGLGQWLLRMDQFTSWCEGSLGKSTLWCHGAPGAGKTFLTSVVIDYLQKRISQTAGAPRVLYFYFDYKQQSEQTPFKVLTSLLRQLLSTYSSIPKTAWKLYEEVENKRCLPDWETLVTIFLGICSASDEVFLVLDALDECDENLNRGPILWLLRCLMRHSVRIFITSRPHPPDVKEAFAECPQITIEAAESDVRAFLHAKIAESSRMARIIDDILCKEIVQTIVEKAQGIQTSEDEVRDALHALPSGLMANLDLTMERIRTQDSQSSSRAQLALRTLMWLSHVRRPLTVDELRHALSITTETSCLNPKKFTQAELLTESCLGLVTIDDETSTVRLVHLSVSEYLQERRETLFPAAHGKLAIHCLVYLLLQDLQGSPPSTKVELDTLLSTYSFLDYASYFWGEHAALCFDAEVEKYTHKLLAHKHNLELWSLTNRVKDSWSLWWLASGFPYDIVRDTSALHVAARSEPPGFPRPNSSHVSRRLWWERSPELLVSTADIDVNLTDSDGNTALSHAIIHDRLESVQLLLSCPDIDVNLGYLLACASGDYPSSNGGSFHSRHKEQITALLLSRPDFDVNVLNPSGAAAWQLAVIDLDFGMLQLLLTRKDLDPSSTESRCLYSLWDICLNLSNSYITTVEGLLNVVLILRTLDQDHRFSMDDFDLLRFTHYILYYAFSDAGIQKSGCCKIGEYKVYGTTSEFREKLRALLESHGCTLSMKDSKGRTYLHCASYLGLEEFGRYLIGQGADVNSRDKAGSTPLHTAVREGQNLLVQLLLDHGADVCALDNDGTSIMHVAANLEEAIPIITTLLDHGATINPVNSFGETPLHDAVFRTNLKTCRFLLENGTDPNKCSTIGTPLHIASHLMNEKLILLIFSYSADPNILDCYGRSSLDHIAGFSPVSEILSSRMVSYEPTPPDVTTRHLLRCLRERIELMVGKPDRQSEFTFRLGKQLLFIGDEMSARVAFEREFYIEEQPHSEPRINRRDSCEACPCTTGLFYFCKRCAFGIFCAKCIKERPEEKDPCRGHEYLEVPGRGWRNLPRGVVNEQGQSFEEWLKDLQKKYSSNQGESALTHSTMKTPSLVHDRTHRQSAANAI